MNKTAPLTVTRRGLIYGGLAGGVAGLSGAAPAFADPPTGLDDSGRWVGRTSANGWPILGSAAPVQVEGVENAEVALAEGLPQVVLTHFIRRYAYELAVEFEPGDILGHRVSPAIDAPFESNYLSGTAVEIRPTLFPIGAGDGLFPAEIAIIENILDDFGGVIAWGQHLDPAKDSHFEIAVAPTSSGLAEDIGEAVAPDPKNSRSFGLSLTRREEAIIASS
ncbi:hypothetical protein [Glycomyces dulcitolivorans]|uniref:hypothetical protein n=1 Tax=Glycomyces dulcitolivorans TaxID=2200759 RepID=UPI001300A7A6|nr:hypothetical protein [Glycomyces dulcitolivorans]